MSTRKLLDLFVKLNDDLLKQGPTDRWNVMRRLAAAALRMYRLQVKYDKAKVKNDMYIEFLEGKPLTEKDRLNLKEAAALNRQIGKHLSDLNTIR